MGKNEPWLWGGLSDVVRDLLDQGWTMREIVQSVRSVDTWADAVAAKGHLLNVVGTCAQCGMRKETATVLECKASALEDRKVP